MGQPPRDFRDKFEKGVRAHVLVPLDPRKNPSEERAIGWCSLHDAEDLDLSFDKFWLEGRVLLSLRVDVIKPPAGHVRRLLTPRLREAEAERGAPLPKAAARDLKEHIVAELRKTTPPKVRTTDMVWSVEAQTLYFFSHSKGTNELFVDLFVQTFGIPLDFQGPGPWAAEIAEEEGLKGRLHGARPTAVFLAGFTGLRPGTRDTDEVSA
jgi:DNA recombination-dependent growth factor C